MVLSDISVKRPVFAAVISLLLVAFGALSFTSLPLREFPDVDPPVVSVRTVYPGASADVVETKITQVIEDQISGIAGLKSMSSESQDGRSDITVEFELDRDIEGATNDVRDGVSRVLGRLPDEADPPRVYKVDSNADVIVWYNLASSTMDGLQLTAYAETHIVDRLAAVDGVAQVRVGGARRYAMRIWLDRTALAARGLTVADVEDALRTENVELPAGRVESQTRQFTVRIDRQYQSAEDFAALVLRKGEDGHLIRLGEVAQVELGPEEYRSDFRGNGDFQIGLGVIRQSTANTLEVARATRAEVIKIRETLPEGTNIFFSFDSSVFIDAAINEVYKTLGIAVVLVLGVIYVFLGSVRAALVPAVTVPVCLVASFMVLAALGYSLNLLTLLALILSIGLVVDDAIVVLENIARRIEQGEPPLLAAFNGARQVAFAVIATTAVLVSVFLPIVFLDGFVGRLFAELAGAVSAAVIFSSLVALTLAPMLCSKVLRKEERHTGLDRVMNDAFARLREGYGASLRWILQHRTVVFGVMVAVLAGTFLLGRMLPSELAPPEDRGAFYVIMKGPEGASFEYSVAQMRKIEAEVLPLIDSGEARRVLARVPAGWGSTEDMSGGVVIVVLDGFKNRRPTDVITSDLMRRFQDIPGVRAFTVMRQGFQHTGGRDPVQFVIGGATYDELVVWRDRILARASENPRLINLDSDYKETRPEFTVDIDRQRAADLGVSVATIGRTLETMMGGRRVTTFIKDGEEYDVMLQADRAQRSEPSDLTNIYARSDTSGQLIPLSNLITVQEQAGPGSLNRYNRLRAITFTAGLAPGYTLGEALDYLEAVAAKEAPEASINYKGQSEEYKDSGAAVVFTFMLALLVVYLVLAAQFESFIHPMVIMMTVPLAVAGAVLGLFIAGSSLNIYSQVGIIILVGLAAKNGILIVEFANQLRDQGRAFRDALVEACEVRLRPVLMTSLSTAIGAVPLLLASGAGAESRVTIGIVVFSGVLLSTALTLFVVPVFYDLMARNAKAPGHVAAELNRLAKAVPSEQSALSRESAS